MKNKFEYTTTCGNVEPLVIEGILKSMKSKFPWATEILEKVKDSRLILYTNENCRIIAEIIFHGENHPLKRTELQFFVDESGVDVVEREEDCKEDFFATDKEIEIF